MTVEKVIKLINDVGTRGIVVDDRMGEIRELVSLHKAYGEVIDKILACEKKSEEHRRLLRKEHLLYRRELKTRVKLGIYMLTPSEDDVKEWDEIRQLIDFKEKNDKQVCFMESLYNDLKEQKDAQDEEYTLEYEKERDQEIRPFMEQEDKGVGWLQV